MRRRQPLIEVDRCLIEDLIAGSAAKPPPNSADAELAALTVVANAIMNLDSFLTKE